MTSINDITIIPGHKINNYVITVYKSGKKVMQIPFNDLQAFRDDVNQAIRETKLKIKEDRK